MSSKAALMNSTLPPTLSDTHACKASARVPHGFACSAAKFNATMATVTSEDRTTSPPSSPQLRVIGFTTSSTASGANEEQYECSSASPHSLPESPLSRLLRSATWPNLRLRLCKSEIPGAAELSGGLKCRVERSCSEQDCCASRHGRSSSPISIPQMYRCSVLLTLADSLAYTLAATPAWNNSADR